MLEATPLSVLGEILGLRQEKLSARHVPDCRGMMVSFDVSSVTSAERAYSSCDMINLTCSPEYEDMKIESSARPMRFSLAGLQHGG